MRCAVALPDLAVEMNAPMGTGTRPLSVWMGQSKPAWQQ